MNKDEVIATICASINAGRRLNPDDHFHFPSDCFCSEREGWSFEYDRGFLDYICAGLTELARTYPDAKRWETDTD